MAAPVAATMEMLGPKPKPRTAEEDLVAKASGPIQDYKPMANDDIFEGPRPDGGEGGAPPWLTGYMAGEGVGASYGPYGGNVFNDASAMIDKNEAAEKVPHGGYHTYKSLSEGAKRGGDISHDMGLGRTMIRQGGMLNSLPDPESL